MKSTTKVTRIFRNNIIKKVRVWIIQDFIVSIKKKKIIL